MQTEHLMVPPNKDRRLTKAGSLQFRVEGVGFRVRLVVRPPQRLAKSLQAAGSLSGSEFLQAELPGDLPRDMI